MMMIMPIVIPVVILLLLQFIPQKTDVMLRQDWADPRGSRNRRTFRRKAGGWSEMDVGQNGRPRGPQMLV